MPGVSADDWQIEPSDVIGITPTTGQIIYSAMTPADSLSRVLDGVDDHFL